MHQLPKTLGWIASLLLVLMAFFHGSGLIYVQRMMNASNAKDFLKEIFPVLFIQPSLHLLGLAVFGILAIYQKNIAIPIWTTVGILIGVDAILAFYLSAWIPGGLLLLAAFLFILAATRLRSALSSTSEK